MRRWKVAAAVAGHTQASIKVARIRALLMILILLVLVTKDLQEMGGAGRRV